MYFIGDTHALNPIFSIIDKHKLEDQKLIHVGDLGLGFQEIRRDVANLITTDEMLQETNNHLYAIRGNHDNPIFWDKSKGLWLPKFHNLHLVDDYEVKIIEGKVVLFIGGAISIDRSIRKSEFPPSWWKDEEFVFNKEKLLKVLKSYGKIDVIVTHTAPAFAYPQNDYVPIVDHYCEIEEQHGSDLRGELRLERENISNVWHEMVKIGVKPSHWIYGHFHSSKKQTLSGVEFKLLNINELYQIN